MFSSKGNMSSMRIMAFMALCSAIVIAFIGLHKNVDLTQLGVLVGSFLVPAFTGKGLQSFAERRDE